MVRAIIFDFDGVIGDTYDISYKAAYSINNDITDEDFRNLFMGNAYERVKTKFQQKDIPIFFERQKQVFTKKNFYPVKQALNKLHKHYQLFIISSTIDGNVNYFLSLGDLDRFFQKVLGGNNHRSKVEKFKMIFNEFNISPEECLFVTDTVGDIIEAREVGIGSIAVTWGYHDEQLLLNQKPLAVAHTSEELLNIINKLK